MGGKKKGNKYIFMFSVMSASPSTPPADVIGKMRRGESGGGVEITWLPQNGDFHFSVSSVCVHILLT